MKRWAVGGMLRDNDELNSCGEARKRRNVTSGATYEKIVQK